MEEDFLIFVFDQCDPCYLCHPRSFFFLGLANGQSESITADFVDFTDATDGRGFSDLGFYPRDPRYLCHPRSFFFPGPTGVWKRISSIFIFDLRGPRSCGRWLHVAIQAWIL